MVQHLFIMSMGKNIKAGVLHNWADKIYSGSLHLTSNVSVTRPVEESSSTNIEHGRLKNTAQTIGVDESFQQNFWQHGVVVVTWSSQYDLYAIFLQTDSPTERINNPTLCVDSPTNAWPYSTLGLLIWWSKAVSRQSYFLQDHDTLVKITLFQYYFLKDYQHTVRDNHINSPGKCRTDDTVVLANVSVVLLRTNSSQD